ncbi:MAG: type II toxin-antitoxin system RelE/ParE family toxin [Saprospiraceae bacterium]|nr:type II toxin-antitoxin system RelE/ParE family toxin [Saprospiraceae bacterium]
MFRNQHRLLAFWDKSNNKNTLVIATHGFIKKSSKVPKNEIQKAENIRSEYFASKK